MFTAGVVLLRRVLYLHNRKSTPRTRMAAMGAYMSEVAMMTSAELTRNHRRYTTTPPATTPAASAAVLAHGSRSHSSSSSPGPSPGGGGAPSFSWPRGKGEGKGPGRAPYQLAPPCA